MSRENKFRARRIDTGEWVYGDYFRTPLTDENSGADPKDGWFFLLGEQRHCIAQGGVAFVIDVAKLGQYTGLKDKNGKEIYEGDILNARHSLLAVQKYYSNMEVFFDTVNGDWKCGPTHQNACLYSGLFQHGDKLEVIGNIYENPELLKEV